MSLLKNNNFNVKLKLLEYKFGDCHSFHPIDDKMIFFTFKKIEVNNDNFENVNDEENLNRDIYVSNSFPLESCFINLNNQEILL